MLTLVEDNIYNSFVAMFTGSTEHSEVIARNEAIIDFTNSELTKYLIKLSTDMEESDEKVIGSYFHVLNDLERIGDHAENFHEIGMEMIGKKLSFSEKAQGGITEGYTREENGFSISVSPAETDLPTLGKAVINVSSESK